MTTPRMDTRLTPRLQIQTTPTPMTTASRMDTRLTPRLPIQWMRSYDNDGSTDGYEVNTVAHDPNDSDSDDDGLTDGYEVNTAAHPTDADSDNDTLTDYAEIAASTNPTIAIIITIILVII